MDPGYIYMDPAHQNLVVEEIKDMMDRRFTSAVVAATGGTYPIICVDDPTYPPKTIQYLRLDNDQPKFTFIRTAGMTLNQYNLTQKGW